MLILEQMCKHFVRTNRTVSYTCMQVSVVSAESKVELHCIRVLPVSLSTLKLWMVY